MEEPIWMAKKAGLPRLLEFYLMDALREGLSQHLANITPCNFLELNKLIALLQFALGKMVTLRIALNQFSGNHNYRDLNFNAKFNPELKFRRIYNDDKDDRPVFYREHMFYLQCTVVCVTSEAIPGAELRKWNGERNICNLKGKKRISFVGREVAQTVFSKLILKAPWTFRGSECIPTQGWPGEEYNLWPLKTGCRTVFV